jgi:phage terminase large subunit-like protein
MKVGSDKRARLRSASVFIQNNMVRFPRKGCEDLIAQILGFGIEDHDDLMDAFVYLVLGLRTEGMDRPEVISLL